ncbi:hypothetical protein SZ00_06177 (plasmid) [Rhodococcus sp. AD45]|nr:hypothetical protein SZ00_06177 [Rhodococcus sp. AD45]
MTSMTVAVLLVNIEVARSHSRAYRTTTRNSESLFKALNYSAGDQFCLHRILRTRIVMRRLPRAIRVSARSIWCSNMKSIAC